MQLMLLFDIQLCLARREHLLHGWMSLMVKCDMISWLLRHLLQMLTIFCPSRNLFILICGESGRLFLLPTWMSSLTFYMLFTMLSFISPSGFFWSHVWWDNLLSLVMLMLLVLLILRIKVRCLLHHRGLILLVQIQICVHIAISACSWSSSLSPTTSTVVLESAIYSTTSNLNRIIGLLLLLILWESALLIWRARVGNCMVKCVVCCSCLFG